MGWWNKVWYDKTKDWTYGPLNANQVPDHVDHIPLVPDKSYINIFLRSMRVVNVRKGLSKFYGATHSFISLSQISLTEPPAGGDNNAHFHSFVSPAQLKNIDANNLDRVLLMNTRLLGPVPYRGGDIELEVGLFSIKFSDLAGAFLGVMESMSKAAGVTFVNAALPFAKPLLDGVNLLSGADGDSILEIGIGQTYQKPETGYFAVVGAESSLVELTKLQVTQDYRLVGADGNAIKNYPYFVLCIEASQKRDDWFKIPEISEAHRNLMAQVRTGKVEAAVEAFGVFKRITLTCPDLLANDADKLIKKVDKDVQRALPAAKTASAVAIEMKPLSEIDLYGE